MENKQKNNRIFTNLEALYPFFHSLQEFICIVSDKGNFEFVNQSLLLFFDVPLSDIKKMETMDVFPQLSQNFVGKEKVLDVIHPATQKRYQFSLNFFQQTGTKTLLQFSDSLFNFSQSSNGNTPSKKIQEPENLSQKIAAADTIQNERLVSTLLGSLPGMVYRCKNDPDWTMLFVSQGCFDLTGYVPEDLIRNKRISYNDLIHPDDQQKTWDQIQDSIQQDRKYEIIYRIQAADQTEKWVWERGQAFYDHNHEHTVLEGFITDITDRIQIEKEAKKAQQQADALREALTEITTQLSLSQVLRKILDSLKKIIAYDSATLFLKLDGEIKIVAARGFENTGLLLNRTFPSDHQLIKDIDFVRKPLILKNVCNDPRFQNWNLNDRTRNWMGIPLIRNHETIGYLTLDNDQPDVYTEEDANTAQLFANGAAVVIENVKLYEKSQQLATCDTLTSIYNRRHFYELAPTEFERSVRYKTVLSIIMLDIDHFKYINDKYGHLTGDQILIDFVKRIQVELRNSDIFARFGGEEFIILLPETDNQQAIQVAERLRVVTAEKPFQIKNDAPYITISLGVATLDETCENLDTLIDRSDKAMYEAKQIGRNRVRTWQRY